MGNGGVASTQTEIPKGIVETESEQERARESMRERASVRERERERENLRIPCRQGSA